MKFSLRRDLGLQLLALYILFVGPIVLAALIFEHVAAQRIEADVKAADIALAQAIAQETNTTLKHALEAVERLATYPEVIEADKRAMDSLFGTLMSARPDVNLVYRLDSDGIMLFHYPIGPGTTVGQDFSFRGYYQQALETHAAILSLGRISPTTEQPVTTAVMPLWDENNNFLGLVATNIKLQSLSTTISSIMDAHRPEEQFKVVIVDSIGHIIADADPSNLLRDLNITLPTITQAVLNGGSGSIIERVGNQQERLYSYVPIPSAGWGVIVSRPTSAAFATIYATRRSIMLTIAVFLVVGIFFWVALSQRVISPLERLATFSRTIGMEEPYSKKQRAALAALSRRPDQIGHLTQSLIRMEQDIAARLEELSTLLETSAAVVSSLESRIVLNRILLELERLMGIQMCAIVALDESRGVFRAQASRGLSQRYVQQMAILPNEPLSVTMRAIRSEEPIQVSDTEMDSTFSALRPRARAEGYRSVVAVPLNTQHAPPSALLVYRPEPHTYTQREVNLLTNFANHATMAIENAALYARSDMRLREQTRRLEALIQSLQDGLVLEDLQGNVLYANRRIDDFVQPPLQDIISAPVQWFLERLIAQAIDDPPGEREKIRRAIEAAHHGDGPRKVEFAIATNRRTRYLRLQVFDVTDVDENPIGRGQIIRDITQNREVDRMKSSLVSTVSHELRTPLAAIKGYATTLLADDVVWDQMTQREFLEIISNETDRLSKLVNDLLDMSRIEAGNLNVTRVQCDPEDLVQRAAERADPQLDSRLKVEIQENLPHLFVDAQRIEAVLRNLIENAVKYAGDTSPILVKIAQQGDSIVIRVQDEGPGIPIEHSQRIFESFYRLEDGLTQSAQGAGLGLAICKGFVNAHGGDIWIEPKVKGACIAFSLPVILGESNTSEAMSQVVQSE